MLFYILYYILTRPALYRESETDIEEHQLAADIADTRVQSLLAVMGKGPNAAEVRPDTTVGELVDVTIAEVQMLVRHLHVLIT